MTAATLQFLCFVDPCIRCNFFCFCTGNKKGQAKYSNRRNRNNEVRQQLKTWIDCLYKYTSNQWCTKPFGHPNSSNIFAIYATFAMTLTCNPTLTLDTANLSSTTLLIPNSGEVTEHPVLPLRGWSDKIARHARSLNNSLKSVHFYSKPGSYTRPLVVSVHL
jgi:hypothetical protein